MSSSRNKPSIPPAARRSTAARRTKEVPSTRTPLALERQLRRLERSCDALRDATDRAEHAQRELLSAMSHDVRNPLSVILISTRMLQRGLEVDTPAALSRRAVEAIARAAEEINHLIQDLLDAPNIEAGNLAVLFEPHDLAAVLARAVEQIRPLAAQKNVTFESVLATAGDLPPVLGDSARILQVLSSLATNALRFTPNGGVVTLTLEVHDEEAHFSIADTGPGITADQEALLFARQRPAGGRIGQGAGLSMFVAKGIVEAHGGAMWAESKLGEGSVFHFTLPVAATSA